MRLSGYLKYVYVKKIIYIFFHRKKLYIKKEKMCKKWIRGDLCKKKMQKLKEICKNKKEFMRKRCPLWFFGRFFDFTYEICISSGYPILRSPLKVSTLDFWPILTNFDYEQVDLRNIMWDCCELHGFFKIHQKWETFLGSEVWMTGEANTSGDRLHDGWFCTDYRIQCSGGVWEYMSRKNRSEQGIINQMKYIKEYSKHHYKTVSVRFHLEKDKDLIELLQNSNNVSELVKCALRNLGRQD